MKVLSVAIPCYNSESYMEKCIKSILPGGDLVEIIIVDDGSSDGTAEIADRYEREYPGIVKAVHQENGGHGEAVNTGIRNATGVYFKVVDSDDYLARAPFLRVLDTLKRLAGEEEQIDLMVCNFVYDKQNARHKKVMRFTHSFPAGEPFGWQRISRLPRGKYLLMHSLIYRTELLKECDLTLPAHTFYVDNLFAYEPLPYVRTMYYMDENLYRYYIGRDDQSVHESVMIKRIDQQLRVNRRMIEVYDHTVFTEKHMKKYMYSYLEIITAISSIMLIRAKTDEALQKKKELMEYMKNANRALYRKYRWGFFGFITNLPGSGGRFLANVIYKAAQKFYGFN